MRTGAVTPSSHNNVSEPDARRSVDLKRAAEQFEAIMIKQFLEPLSSSLTSSGGFDKSDGGQPDSLGDFAINALAGQISKSGGLGIAKFIAKAEAGKTDQPSERN